VRAGDGQWKRVSGFAAIAALVRAFGHFGFIAVSILCQQRCDCRIAALEGGV
jgi:hypothetical protein